MGAAGKRDKLYGLLGECVRNQDAVGSDLAVRVKLTRDSHDGSLNRENGSVESAMHLKFEGVQRGAAT